MVEGKEEGDRDGDRDGDGELVGRLEGLTTGSGSELRALRRNVAATRAFATALEGEGSWNSLETKTDTQEGKQSHLLLLERFMRVASWDWHTDDATLCVALARITGTVADADTAVEVATRALSLPPPLFSLSDVAKGSSSVGGHLEASNVDVFCSAVLQLARVVQASRSPVAADVSDGVQVREMEMEMERERARERARERSKKAVLRAAHLAPFDERIRLLLGQNFND